MNENIPDFNPVLERIFLAWCRLINIDEIVHPKK